MTKRFMLDGRFLRTSALGLSLAFTAAMTACTSSAPPPAGSLTLEQMVRLPVEKDREGVTELGNYLRDFYGVRHGQPLIPESSGHLEKIQLPDGNLISEAYVGRRDDAGKETVAFLVDPSPCVPIRISAEWIGAAPNGDSEETVRYRRQNASVRVTLISSNRKCLSMVVVNTTP